MCKAVAVVAALLACAVARGAHDVEWCGGAATKLAPPAESAAIAPSRSSLDFFTNYGNYLPRTHCIRNEAGETDWPWVGILLVLTSLVVIGYLRIFAFWLRCYHAEAPCDRNPKLRDLAYIFFFCAICGYVLSITSFFWPAYRLLACFLVVLNCFTWRFAATLRPFAQIFKVQRLQRELNDALRSRNSELERLVRERTAELERAKTVAVRASAFKTQFIANISHEIRTPMTAIIGFADLLAEPHQNAEDRAACVATIRRNGEHLLTLINDVLDLSKIEAGQLRVETIAFRPAQVFDEAVALLRSRADDRGLALVSSCATPIPAAVTGDPTRFRQVLINLLSNAIKFTERGSVRLDARYDAAPGRLTVSVTDTGIGMTPEQIGRLFQPFQQADDTVTRRFGGTGLGLTISKRLCELMGGDIAVTSESGRGTTFTVTLPASPVGEEHLRHEHATAAPSDASASRAMRLTGRILLVEDGPDNQRLIGFHLRRAGADVVIASDGVAGVEAALAARDVGRPFGLILMDLQMPRLDGLSALAQIRRGGITAPVVALTANSMAGDRQHCLAQGCAEYVSKPVDVKRLLAVCQHFLNGAGAAPAGAATAPAQA